MRTVVRWNPLREMINLRSEMDRLFAESMGLSEDRWLPGVTGLDVDLVEKDESFVVRASIPGIHPDNLELSIVDNVLTIKGEIKEEKDIDEEQYRLRERRFGSFCRNITLPMKVRADAVEADYENGVLTLDIPKAEELKPKRIAVKVHSPKGKKVIEG